MNPYFYSLGLLVTGRGHDHESPYLSVMDVLAYAIADDEKGAPRSIQFLWTEKPEVTGRPD